MLVYRTDDPTRWGAGKGDDLDPVEVDLNFWDHETRIADLETNPPVPVSIASITSDGKSLTVHLTDGSTQGPFKMPVAAFRVRGVWANSVPYEVNDIFTAPGYGTFLVLIAHVSPAAPAEFDPNISVGGSPALQWIFPAATPRYVVAMYAPGAPGFGLQASDPMFVHLAGGDFSLPAGLEDSSGELTVAATAAMTGAIRKNGVDIGSWNIGAGATAVSFTFATTVPFTAGDRLTMSPPAAIDATARNLAITLRGLVQSA